MENTENYEWTNVTFEDFPENGCLKACLSAFDSLETIVTPYTDLSLINGIVKEGIFSNINLLRQILISTFACQQYVVPSEEGEIDCLIVKNRKNIVDAPIIIFCNPNGGLYEYSCYQNQWLDFYINIGVDICL